MERAKAYVCSLPGIPTWLMHVCRRDTELRELVKIVKHEEDMHCKP